MEVMRAVWLKWAASLALILILQGAAPARGQVDEAPSASPSEPSLAAPVAAASPPVDIAVLPPSARALESAGVTLRFYVLDERGAPLSGVEVLASCEGADAGRVIEPSPGVYQVQLGPDAASEETTEAVLTLTTADGAVREQVRLPVIPEEAPAVKLDLAATTLLLGAVESIPLRVDASVPGWPVPGLAELRVQSSVGRVVDLRDMGDGRFEGRYVLPESRNPQVAMIAVSVGEGAFFRWGWTRLPLSGRRDQTYEVDAGATVYASVSGKRFGPSKADAQGQATLTLEVQPGADHVDIESRTGAGGLATLVAPLVLPPFPQEMLIVERKAPAPGEPVKVVALAVDASGAPRPLSEAALVAEAGRFDSVSAVEPGVLQATYVPPTQAGGVRLSVQLAEGRGAVVEPTRLEIPPGRAQRLKVRVTPTAMRVDDPPAQVEVQILDSQGMPAGGGRLVLDTSLGAVSQPSQVAAGTLVAALTPPRELGEQSADGVGSAEGEVSAQLFWFEGASEPGVLQVYSPRRLMDPALWPDGLPVAVRLLDELGLPLPRRHINGRVLEGGGTLSGGVTDAGGWVTLTYRPADLDSGAAAGAARLRVLVEDMPRLQTELLIVVSPSGDERFDRPAPPPEAGAPDLVATAPIEVRAGRVKQVQITVQPNDLYVGSLDNATVRVRLLDGRGNVVQDPQMHIEVQEGEISNVRLDASGVHLATYRPPQRSTSAVVQLQVTGEAEEFAGGTEIFLKEQRDRLLVSSQVGVITNLRQITAPIAMISMLHALPGDFSSLYVDVGAQYHPFSLSFEEPDGLGIGQLRTDVVSLWLGGAYRTQLGPIKAEGGLGMVGAGVFYATTFADESQSPTASSVAPGLRFYLSGEVGLGPGGLAVSMSFTRIAVKGLDLGPDGNIGGLCAALGYVVHLR